MTYQPQTTFAGGKSPFANCLQTREPPPPKTVLEMVTVKQPPNQRPLSAKSSTILHWILQNPSSSMDEMGRGMPQYLARDINYCVKSLYRSKRLLRTEGENRTSKTKYTCFFYKVNQWHESNYYLYQ